MATQSIKVPVELQLKNLGSAIDTLKSALKGVSANSGLGQELAKEIKSLEKKYANLAQEAKRSFTSAGEVQTFGNHFRKLSESVEITAERFKELRFSDLKLPENLQTQFDTLQKKITDAKIELENLVNTSFKKNSTEAGSDLAISLENFKKAFSDLKFDTTSFDATYAAVKDKLIDLQREKDKLDRKMATASSDYEGAKKQFDYYNTIKEQLTKVKNKAQLENFAAMYEGQAQKLNVSTDEYLKNILGIDMQALRVAADKGEQELNQIITNLLNSTSKGTFGKMFTDKLNTVNSKLQIFEGLQGDSAKINGLISTVKELDAALESFSQGGDLKTKTEELQVKLRNAQQAMKEFVTETVNSSGALQQSGAAAQQAAASLQPLQNKIEATKNKIQQLNEHAQKMNRIKQTIGMWFGLTRAFQTVRKTVNAAVKEIRELDKVMTEIAVVTDMNQKQLWGQINTYSNIAKQYGVSTLGAYQVSQLWYQQGLQTNEVMELTTETLKMAKIANLDYSTATDYMTVAIRGFKLEMSEAATVTDVYSALAAGTASNTKELAVAMSKTASSAEAVGSSFESTSAMIATMISVTREAPENIGSAMKSIISRYGEMTSDPTKLVDGEGEAMSLNKVDKALQSVGISLQDAKGEFRDFDDVILELAKSWDTIDTNTQRYIATVMAGNRQQSRFLALVGNYEEYARALEIANNSEDAGTLQALKTMDSLETKIQGVKTAWQQFYNSMGLEEAFKGGLEVITQIINNLSRLNKPAAFATIYTLFTNLGSIVKNLFNMISNLIKSVGITTKAELDKLEEERKIKLSNSEANKNVNETQQKVNDLEKSKKITVQTNEAQEKINKLKQTIAGLTTSNVTITGKGKNSQIGSILNSVSLFGRGSHEPLRKAMNQFSRDSGIRVDDPAFFSKFAESIQNNTALLKQLGITTEQLSGKKQQEGQASQNAANADNSSANSSRTLRQRFNELGASVKQVAKKALDNNLGFGTEKGRAAWSQVANGLITAGTMLTAAALTIKDSYTDNTEKSKITAGWGNLLSAVGGGISGGIMGISGGIPGIIIGAVAGALPGLIGAFKSFSDGIDFTIKERLALLEDEINESKNTATKSKGEAISLKNSLDELKQLEEAQYDSAEATQAYKDKMAQMGETYPELIAWTDAAGDATIDATLAEQALAEARVQAAEDALDLAEQEFTQKELERKQAYIAQKGLNTAFEDVLTTATVATGLAITGISINEDYEFGSKDIIYPSALAGIEQYDQETENLTAEGWSAFKTALTKFFTEGATSLTDLERTLLDGVIGLSGDYNTAMTRFSKYATLTHTKVEDLQQIPASLLHADGNDWMQARLKSEMINAFAAIGKTEEDLLEFLGISGWDDLSSDKLLSGEKIFEAYENVVGYIDNLIEQRTDYLNSYGQALAKSQFDKDLSELAQSNVIDNPELYDIISEYSSMFSTLMTGMLTTKKGNMDWSDYFDSDQYQADAAEINELFDSFILQFNGNAQALEDFIQIYDNPNHFKNADELRAALSELGINMEEFKEVEDAIVQRYNNSVAAARKRVNDAVANSESQVTDASYEGETPDKNSKFSELFDGTGVTELSTQYADHVVDSINQINDLAEDGLVASAELLADTVLGVYSEIGQLDSEAQTEVFDIIKQVDWTDASSLTSAIEGMEKYIESLASKNQDTSELEDVLAQLQEAKDNLIFNVQTEFQNYRDAIVASVEGTSKVVSNLTDGLELAEAFEAFNTLIAQDGMENKTFQELFEYNEALGKWVYTQEGFSAAIHAEKQALEEARVNAEQTYNRFIETFRDEEGNIFESILGPVEALLYNDDKLVITDEELGKLMSENFQNMDADQRAIIEKAIRNYNPQDGKSFKEYIESLIETYAKSSEQAAQMLEAFLQNESKMILSGLDFSNLSSGVNVEGSRRILEEAYVAQAQENWRARGKTDSEIEDLMPDIQQGAEVFSEAVTRFAVEDPLEALQWIREFLGDESISEDDVIALVTSGADALNSGLEKLFDGNINALSEAERAMLVQYGFIQKNADTGLYELTTGLGRYDEAIQFILENASLTAEQAAKMMFDTITFGSAAGAQKAQVRSEMRDRTSFDSDALAKITTHLAEGGLQEGAAFGEQGLGIINKAGQYEQIFSLNAETGQWVIANVQAYWTKILGLTAGTAEYFEFSARVLEEQPTPEADLNKLRNEQAQAIANLKTLAEGQTVNVQSLGLHTNWLNQIAAFAYGFKVDSNGLISAIEGVEQDYIGLYRFLYNQGLFMQDVAASEFEAWIADQIDATITESVEQMQNAQSAIEALFEGAGQAGAVPLNLENLRQIEQLAPILDQMGWEGDTLDLSSLTSDQVIEFLNLMVEKEINFEKVFGKTREQIYQEYEEIINSTIEEITTAEELLTNFITPTDTEFSSLGLYNKIVEFREAGNANADVIISKLQAALNAGFIQIFDSENNLLDPKSFDFATEFDGSQMIKVVDGQELNDEYVAAIATLMKLFGADVTKIREIRNEMMGNVISEQESISSTLNSLIGAKAGDKLNVASLIEADFDENFFEEIGGTLDGDYLTLSGPADIRKLSQQNLEKFLAHYGGSYEQAMAAYDAAVNQAIEDQNAGINAAKEQLDKILSGETGEFAINSLLNQMNLLQKMFFKSAASAGLIEGLSLTDGVITIEEGFNPSSVLNYFKGIMNELGYTEAQILAKRAENARSTIEKAEKNIVSANSELDAILDLEEGFSSEITYLTAVFGSGIQGVIEQFGYAVENEIATATANADPRGLLNELQIQGKLEQLGRDYLSYLEQFSSLVDEEISRQTSVGEGASSSLGNIREAKVGDKINVVYLVEALTRAGENANEILEGYGIQIDQGLATIGENADIYGLMQEIAALESSGALEISDSLGELKDAIQEMFNSWISALSAGLAGNLSNADVESLKQQFTFLTDADFSRTKEGLKISQQAAYELYQHLKSIDSIAAQLALDALVESTMDAEQGMNDIYTVMGKIRELNEEIADTPYGSERYKALRSELEVAEKIRSTLEDSGNAYNFMDRDLPTAMTNPLSAWEGVGDALSILDGDQFAKEGNIDFTSLYNMITMMDDMGVALNDASLGLVGELHAAKSNEDIMLDLVRSMSNATVVVDGEPVVDVSEMYGDGFVVGTENMRKGIAMGMEELAQSQIEVIDAQIELLEIIVAMEEISDIDIDGDGIELEELFEFDAPDGTFDSWDEVTGITKEHQDFLLGLLEETQTNEELKKRLQETLVNGKSLYDIIAEMSLSFDGYGNVTERGKQLLEELGLSVEQYLALMKGIENMVESGDYDLDTVMSSVAEQLANGFHGSELMLDFGGKTVVFTAEGLSYEINWGENGELVKQINRETEGTHTEETIREAISRVLNGTGSGDDQFIFQVATGQIIIEQEGENVVYKTKDGKEFDSSADATRYSALKTAKDQLEASGTQTPETLDRNAESFTVQMGAASVEVSYSESGVSFTATIPEIGTVKAATQDELIATVAQKLAEKQGGGETAESQMTEARMLLGMPLDIQLNAQAVSGLAPTELQQLANAYYSGNNELFLDLVTKYNLLPEGETIQFPEGADPQEYINSMAAKLGMSSLPIPVTISFSGVTAEEATTLASSIGDLADNCVILNGLTFGSFSSLTSSLQGAFGENSSVLQTIDTILQKLQELDQKEYTIDLIYNISQNGEGQEQTTTLNVDDAGATSTLTGLATAMLEVNTSAGTMTGGMTTVQDELTTTGNAFATAASQIAVATSDINRLKEAVAAIPSGNEGRINNLNTAIKEIPIGKALPVQTLAKAMNNIPSGTKSITVKVTVKAQTPTGSTVHAVAKGDTSFRVLSKGNAALAKGTGTALASGRRTLMGELGPELVVSDGRYFTVGNNGAEFVDLPSDAIVFNHLQTKKLLGSGGMVGTGEPVTNERNAVAFAGGNVSGPAMANAKEALTELYKLKAMWQGLLDAAGSELGKKAGGNGLGSGKGPGGGGGSPGGGGGDGGGSGSGDDIASVVGDLDRWYNLLRQIAKLEQQITNEQAKRENMMNGFDRNESLKKELDLLKKQYEAQKKLSKIQRSYYDARRADLDATDYSKIFTYDEDGLMQYVDGQGRGLDILATLNKTDENGKAVYNAKEQLDYLKNTVDFNTDVLKINADGTKAEDEEQMMQNFWDGVDGWMEEMDSLYDSYNEAATAMEEATSAMNEILNEQIENQLTVEEKLLKAIEDREQAEIDRIQDEKEALEAAAQEYIDGLNTALEKERSMYEKNESDAETSRLQRQLAILQRSGGSASEIKSLQDQIDSRLKDAYFEEQQNQIDAIQEASDNQLEKLQTQIDIMTESFEYQKEQGLLWEEVYKMMQTWTPEAMMEFIETYDADYKTNSATQNQQNTEETLPQIQQWVGHREDIKEQERQAREDAAWEEYYNSLELDKEIKEKGRDKARTAFGNAYGKEENLEAAKKAADESFFVEKDNQKEETDDNNNNGGDDNKVTTEKVTGKGKVKTKGSNLNVRSGPGTNYGKIGKLKNKSSVTLTGYNGKWYQIDYNGKKGYVSASYITTSDKKKLPAFASGGLVDFTGPAWVDGTKSKPEAFLSASDTAMLKSKIFSNSDGSLKSLVAALEEITSNTARHGGVSTEQIVIQNAQVNIQPGTISNDYDARRAGEMALEEMVKIARKTTNRVVSR